LSFLSIISLHHTGLAGLPNTLCWQSVAGGVGGTVVSRLDCCASSPGSNSRLQQLSSQPASQSWVRSLGTVASSICLDWELWR
jgi:hypothetical protein